MSIGVSFTISVSYTHLPLLAVTVADIVDGTFVVLLKNGGIKYILAHELLVGHRCDDIFSSAEEDNHVIYGRAVAYEFVFLQSSSDETLFAVDVQLFVCLLYTSSTSKCMTGAMKPSMTCEKVHCPFFFL